MISILQLTKSLGCLSSIIQVDFQINCSFIICNRASFSPEKEHVIQHENKSGQSVSNRVKMVYREFKIFQWKMFDSTKSPSSNSDRCLSEGTGTHSWNPLLIIGGLGHSKIDSLGRVPNIYCVCGKRKVSFISFWFFNLLS